MDQDVSKHVPMKPVTFAVLLTLNDGECHGYQIMKEVKARTNGMAILGPGSLYRILKEMSDSGLIERSPVGEDGTTSSDERRRYYRITEFGRRAASAEASRMRSLVEAAESGKLVNP